MQPVRGQAGSSKQPDPVTPAHAIRKRIRWVRPYKGSNKKGSAYENLVGKTRKQVHDDLRKQFKKQRLSELKKRHKLKRYGSGARTLAPAGTLLLSRNLRNFGRIKPKSGGDGSNDIKPMEHIARERPTERLKPADRPMDPITPVHKRGE